MQEYLKQLISVTNKRPRLLIVDDQISNINLLHELLSKDFDIYIATNGQHAIMQCLTLLPDLVLLDVIMPQMSGYEVCRIIHADPATQDIPVIFLTAQRSEQNEVKGLELGAVDFITKPINSIILNARISIHLSLKIQRDLLIELTLLDGLTKVPNRRKFDQSFEKLWLHSIRLNQPISLLMIDIDLFKSYNDSYGHAQGDQCLALIAQTLNKSINRPLDLLARYGGEEFVCLLPNTDLFSAEVIANNMLDSVRGLLIPNVNTESKIVTISIGLISKIPLPTDDHTDFIKIADKAMYQSKNNGRNQITIIEVN